MAFDTDDEILQDFLVEAGEILEQLNGQLLELEQQPDDYDLLNAVFRGFHTIKGGAGFLSIEPMVEVCHRSEDVFNVLRQRKRRVDAQLMDVVLRVLDVVNDMFERVRAGEDPEPADPELLSTLEVLAEPASEGAQNKETTDTAAGGAASSPAQDVEAIPQVSGAGAPVPASGAESDQISEDEFEALLDQLHGKGQHGGIPKTAQVAEPEAPAATPAAHTDEISEEEFEALLDQLHGEGRHGGLPNQAGVASVESEQTPVAASSRVSEAQAPLEHADPGGDVKAESTETPALSAAESQPKIKSKTHKKNTVTEHTVRVETARLDQIMNMVGELVLVRNRLATLKMRLDDEAVSSAVTTLDVVTSDLQNAVMKTRMQPIKKVFGRFPRLVRDLSRSMGKEIKLEMFGEDTDLDKNLVEALADPMVHLVRNAVDHGIEPPEERERMGKSPSGTLKLSAVQEGDHILLQIADDGRGMDPDVLRRKAVEKGILDANAAERLEEKECFNLIFEAGFSTKQNISDISGRGVGMDVVKTRIAQMSGSVDIDSTPGVGTTITIRLPLTLAILPTLMVTLGAQSFAIPLSSVVEIINMDWSSTNVIDGQKTLLVRERALPLFFLRQWLIKGADEPREGEVGHVVVVSVHGNPVGLVVDGLVGQEEVVIKPLGAMLHGLEGMAGATITGDGKIALILDIPGLMRKYTRRR